jgi:hypothetical protein
MLESPAFCTLSLTARRILGRLEIEIAHHGGHGNGKLAHGRAVGITELLGQPSRSASEYDGTWGTRKTTIRGLDAQARCRKAAFLFGIWCTPVGQSSWNEVWLADMWS